MGTLAAAAPHIYRDKNEVYKLSPFGGTITNRKIFRVPNYLIYGRLKGSLLLKRAGEISIAGGDRSTLIFHIILVLAFLFFSFIFLVFFFFFLVVCTLSAYYFSLISLLVSIPIPSSLHLSLSPSPFLFYGYGFLLFFFSLFLTHFPFCSSLFSLSLSFFSSFSSPLHPLSYSRIPRRGNRVSGKQLRPDVKFVFA